MLFSMIKMNVVVIRYVGTDDGGIQYNHIYFQ